MTLNLDTSALVKLYISEAHDETVETAVRDATSVGLSVIAYPEARSAFARKVREGTLIRDDHDQVVHALDQAWDGFHRVQVTYEIAYTAGELAERLALRGFDAVHVASAIRLQNELGETVRFLTFDERLKDAVRQVLPVYETE